LICDTPDPVPSFALSVTVTGEVSFHPAAFAAGLSEALTVGGVVSITIPALACDATGEKFPSA
jgi:hypothetical protein